MLKCIQLAYKNGIESGEDDLKPNKNIQTTRIIQYNDIVWSYLDYYQICLFKSFKYYFIIKYILKKNTKYLRLFLVLEK